MLHQKSSLMIWPRRVVRSYPAVTVSTSEDVNLLLTCRIRCREAKNLGAGLGKEIFFGAVSASAGCPDLRIHDSL